MNFKDVDRYVTERKQERQRTRTKTRRSKRAVEIRAGSDSRFTPFLGGVPASESAGCSLKTKFGSRRGSCYQSSKDVSSAFFSKHLFTNLSPSDQHLVYSFRERFRHSRTHHTLIRLKLLHTPSPWGPLAT